MIKRLFRLTVLLFLVTASIQASASLLDNLFEELTLSDEAHASKHALVLKGLKDENLSAARTNAVQLMNLVSEDLEVESVTYAKILTNTGILYALSGNNAEAEDLLNQAVAIVESVNVYHTALLNILRARSYVELTQEQHEAAIQSLKRAQHISHRSDGVYTKLQLPLIEALASINIGLGQLRKADTQQKFNLKVSEQVFGVRSEELIPTLDKLAKYFAMRASSISYYSDQQTRLYRDSLFRLSVNLFKRSISIIEDKYGPNDLRLIDPLKGLSRTRYIQGVSKVLVKESMERAAGIVTTNPSSDVSDHAKSLVELADTYVITTDGRALDVYTEAWEMLADPEFDDLRYQLFGTPKMLFPDEPIQPVLARHPMNAVVGDELFVDIEYDIRHDGRVRNVKIVEGNVPNEEKKMLKTYVSRLKYRPRIVEGEFFMTEGLSWHQTFRVLEKVPEPTNVSPVVVGDGS